MYQPTELKKGVLIQIDGKPFQVIDYNQKVMGRGGSIVNVKLRNLVDGAVIPKTFKGQERIESAEVTSLTVQYLYRDDNKMYFMNQETFDQYDLNIDFAPDSINYLIDGLMVDLQFFEGKVINLVLPKNLYLKVVYAENVVKGDTSSSVQKDAKLETGMTIRVPAFIKTGDEISVDTSTGLYRERKK